MMQSIALLDSADRRLQGVKAFGDLPEVAGRELYDA